MTDIRSVTRECIANGLMGVPLIRNWRVRRGRTVLVSTNDQVQKILDQFDFHIGAIGWEGIRDKTIVEIGPGDAIPLGLLFLGAGAKQYVVVDRFLGSVSNAPARHLYRALIEAAPEKLRQGWQEKGLDPYQYPWLEAGDFSPRIKLIRKSIEETDLDESERGDIIISFNVVEHLSDATRAFGKMAEILKPGGSMVHRVDYGPHGYGQDNPLKFLTVSNRLWRLMGSNRGWPNRLRHSQVVQALENSGFKSTDRITRSFDLEDLRSIRPFLSRDFRKIRDADLLVADAEIHSSLNV